jgi:Ser/Thr protein kinase RdoA (MazF antagonist)
MEQAIAALLDEAKLDALSRGWGVAGTTLETLGDFENFVYACEIDGRPGILRITHGSHRSSEAVSAELEWIEHLAKAGIGAARPIASRSGNWIETLEADDGQPFTAAAFERAPGRPPVPDDWNSDFYREWGRTLARMHAATRDYRYGFADAPGRIRHRWDENRYLTQALDFVSAGDDVSLVRDRLSEIQERLKGFPSGRADIGLIHEDLHASNFHLHEGKLVVFDFDDACYHWWVDDLAMVLYYALWGPAAADDRDAFARDFLADLVAGYREILPIEDEALARIPVFLKLRELMLFIVCQAKWEPETRNDGEGVFIDRYRKRIRAGTPYVNLGRWDEAAAG